MIIKANDLKGQFELYQNEYEEAAIRALRSGWYILGNELKAFEEEFKEYLGAKHCVGVASGLDALIMGFRLLCIEKGDEVIVASNAYIACVMGITINGGVPVFVEPDDSFNIDPERIKEAITDKTKAILVVHLYGAPCDMKKIISIANENGLAVIEDCAQAHGTESGNRKVGTFGTVGCFSFYPTKGLGGFGDGGAIVTNDDDLARHAQTIRNYGSEKKYIFSEVGMNSRLDEIQAALLRVKLSHLDEILIDRKRMAEEYLNGIKNDLIKLPRNDPGHTWHQFVIQTEKRDELRSYLEQKGIGTEIHYPIPPHLSAAYSYLGLQEGSFPIGEKYSKEVLSLPMYAGMTKEEQAYVIDALNKWK